MKKLFFLLLVANLVIWVWGQRSRLDHVAETPPPGLGAIRLVDDAELAARREEARRQAAAPEPADGAAPPVVAEPRVPVAPVVAGVAAIGSEVAATGSGDVPAVTEEPATGGAAPSPALPPEVSPLPAVVTAEAPASPAAETVPALEIEAPPPVAASEAMPGAAEPTPAEPIASAPTGLSEGAAPEPVGEPAAERVPVPVAESVEVVASAAAASADAAVDAGPAVAAQAAALPVVDADAAPVQEPPPAVEPQEVRYLCESIGPFADRPTALGVQSSINPPLRGATLREERVTRPGRHWVLAPVQPSKEATAEYLASLAQAGVKDAWRIPSGPLAGRLAVGVFQLAENARKHADMLAAKGVAAEVHAPKAVEGRVYWVDYERPADAPPPQPGAAGNRAGRQIVPRDCSRVARPGTLP